jgi:hypothetical protein
MFVMTYLLRDAVRICAYVYIIHYSEQVIQTLFNVQHSITLQTFITHIYKFKLWNHILNRVDCHISLANKAVSNNS